MNNKEVAERVRELREQRKLTQEEIADVLGIRQPAYSDLENGVTAFKAVHLDKLASFYGISLDDLIRGGHPVLNMNDHASNGYNVIYTQNVHGISEDLVHRLCNQLEGNAAVMKELASLLGRMIGGNDGVK